MLKGLSNNRAGLHKELGFLIFMAFLAGCSYVGMTEIDYKLQKEGLVLHCTEVAGEECLTHQWVNTEMANSYRRYHGPSINGTNSSDN
jgi:hypothetical protein